MIRLCSHRCNSAANLRETWRRGSAIIAIGFALLPALACTNAVGPVRLTVEDLLAGAVSAREGTAPSIPDEADVLAVSPEMIRFLDAHVDRTGTPEARLRQLISAIIDSKTFGLEYDDRTRTASETFRVRRGNCLAFSTMFVAMARHVGLNAEYQEVDIPPDWVLDKDTFVLNQHVNVFVDVALGGRRIVDFNIGDFRATYDLRRISDARALAHYYNNIGVERMQAGETGAALACFRRAIEEGERRFSPAWTNLGTLYLRNGDRPAAEAAYLHALRSAPDLVAMSNLARLYELAGDAEKADRFRQKVAKHRAGNPYYRYELGRRAYEGHRYDEAVRHLRYAARKRPKEDEFAFLLALAYLQKGDAASAQWWLARAEEVAASDALKRRYSNKIEILMGKTGR